MVRFLIVTLEALTSNALIVDSAMSIIAPLPSITPESVIWDQIALDGYKVRWFNKKIYYCEYLEDGLTKSSWSLLKNNPMGYAMLFNTQLKYITKNRINTILQFISCCCLAREYKYIKECNSPFVWLLLPFGWLLSMRRRKQINKFCP